MTLPWNLPYHPINQRKVSNGAEKHIIWTVKEKTNMISASVKTWHKKNIYGTLISSFSKKDWDVFYCFLKESIPDIPYALFSPLQSFTTIMKGIMRSSVPVLQEQDDRTEGVPTDEVGPQGHNEVVDAWTSVLHRENDQLTLPAVIICILVRTVLAILLEDAYNYKSSDSRFNTK